MKIMSEIIRYYFEMENVTPLKIGTGDMEDQLFKIDGNYAIPATSVAGVFREFLKNKTDDSIVNRLLGSNEEEYRLESSPLFFYDFTSDGKEEIASRNHVRINREYGSSENKSLYIDEYIKPGSIFKGVIEYKVYKGQKDDRLIDAIKEFSNAINKQEVSFGANSNLAYGKFKMISLKVLNYDLKNEDSLKAYLNLENIFSDTLIKDLNSVQNFNDNTSNYDIVFKGSCKDGLFIDSGNPEKVGEKTIQKPYVEKIDGSKSVIIPSSTIKGIFRSHIEKIIKLMNLDEDKIKEHYFGEKKISFDGIEKVVNTKSGIEFSDVVVDNSKIGEQVLTNIMIDRFTAGVYDGSPRSNEVIFVEGDDIQINIKLSEKLRKDVEKGMISLDPLFYSLRDLGVGDLRIGSKASIGYGKIEGSSFRYSNFNESEASINKSFNYVFENSEKTSGGEDSDVK